MNFILKKLNINDYLLVLLLIIPFFPLTPIFFLIGHTYFFEILILLYGIINIIYISVKPERLKTVFKFNKIYQTFLLFFLFILLNFFISILFSLKLESNYILEGIKIHINVLRGFIEFLFIFIFINFNFKNANYFNPKRFIFMINIIFVINLIIPFIYIIYKANILKIITDAEYFLNFRKTAQSSKYMLPNGTYAIFLLNWICFLFFYKKNNYFRILGIILAGIASISIFITYSRIFLPAFIFLIIFQIIFLLKKRCRIYFLIIFIFFIILSGNMIKKRISIKVEQYSSLSMGSGRLYLIGSVFSILSSKEKLFYGVGCGNYHYYSYKYVPIRIFQGYNTPHNQLLTLITGTGILGYLLFLYFICLLVYEGFKKIKNSKNKERVFRISNLSIILSFFLMSLFAEMIISYHPPMTHHLIFLWIFMGLIASSDKKNNLT